MCNHYNKKLTDKDRYFVLSPEHNNCVLCLVNSKGAMTQEEVGGYLGLTKMRISQIERQAIRKLQKRTNFIDSPLHF